jgi:hypothetical protein
MINYLSDILLLLDLKQLLYILGVIYELKYYTIDESS